MNFSLNIHRVTKIRLSAVRLNQASATRYATRDLIIETSEGNFELSLFSIYVDEDSEQELLEVKV
jgi:hypothetical protein